MTVSLLEILAAARAHAAPLAAESAGYLLLAVADRVLAAPRVVTAADVELMPDGCVRLCGRRGGSSDVSVELGIRQLLARTLAVSSSVGPALRRAAARGDETGLPSLVRELETALIPVNRSAAKRALSRLHRETERAKAAGKLDALLQAEAAPVAAAPGVAMPGVPAPGVAAPVVPAPVVAAPVVPAPVVAAPVVPAPVVAAAVVPAPVVAAVDAIALAVEWPEPSPSFVPAVAAALALPIVVATPVRAPKPVVAAPVPELTLTPEPQLAVAEPAFTKPEPVVQRAKERGNRTPRLGTLVTLQTLPGEEGELTERAPAVALEQEEDPELDLSIDVELEVSPLPVAATAEPQPLLDPEPSCMPDVLTAMVTLHTGVEADDAPTRIRDVVTELRAPSAQQMTPEPLLVDDAWLTHSSLAGVVSSVGDFGPELIDPAVHEAVTWNPGPVAAAANPAPRPPALLILEPAPEPSPYAPAVLPARTSDVSELLDSFYVSSAPAERELRSALKEMAGLELTPMPHPYVEEG